MSPSSVVVFSRRVSLASYASRSRSSDRTSYALLISRNSSVVLPSFLSGCHRSASRRYAFLIAAASGGGSVAWSSPSTWYSVLGPAI